MKHISRREVLGAAAVSMALAACGGGGGAGKSTAVSGDWKSVVEAAKKEGKLQLYFSIGQDVIDHLNAGFKKAYPGIDVAVYRSTGGSANVIARMENDRAAHAWKADVVDVAAPMWLSDAIKQGIVATDVDVPEAKNWSSKYWHDGIVVLTPTVLGVSYNTKLVKKDELPTSWEQMKDHRWKGRMGWWEPRPNTDSHTNLYELYYEKYGAEFITALMKLKPRFWDDANSLAQGVAAGESGIGPAFLHKVEDLKKTGAPIDYVVLEPAPTFLNSTFVAKDAPHPNAARVFLNYALSKAGQAAISAHRLGNSMLSVPGAIPNPSDLYVPNIKETAKHYPEFMKLIGRTAS